MTNIVILAYSKKPIVGYICVMKKLTIYHNPRCSKSRKALETLTEKGEEVDVIEYLKTPLTKKILKNLLMKLNMKPIDIIRVNEDVFKDNFKGKNFTDDEWIQILIENPILLQRPIVVGEYKAEIMR
ncbi:MAG: arsenate reductase (glutaredoxin) [Bacteroidia bacterium]